MYGTYDFTIEYFKSLCDLLLDENIKIIVCPPLQFANLGRRILFEHDNTQITIGAQNVSHLTEVASTGEVSVEMLEECDTKAVIVGHSERRAICDNDEYINKKIKNLQSSSICPILCIGENADIRKSGDTEVFLENQIKTALKDIKKLENLVVAYEPIWAIGTGKTPTQDDISSIAKFITKTVNSLCDVRTLNVVYGGSVNDKNLHEMLSNKDISGVLIGSFSLKTKEFCQALENIKI